MAYTGRPGGPRGAIGASAEDAAADHLRQLGWAILARNLRVGRDEIDILAAEPATTPVLVLVEVRSRSTSRFGAAIESVDGSKVRRLYRAAQVLARRGASDAPSTPVGASWRVDLLAMHGSGGRWRVACHVRGLAPP